MSFTLVCIDMQQYFTAANGEKVQRACVREIKQAMKKGATILFVEYDNYGPTLPLLTDLVKKAKYKKVHYLVKDADGGGAIIADYLRKRHLTRSNIRVVGVNTNYCVQATVEGLNHYLNNSYFHIVADACASRYSSGHKYGLAAMSKLPNTKILRLKK